MLTLLTRSLRLMTGLIVFLACSGLEQMTHAQAPVNSQAKQSDPPRNVLLIMADDLNVDLGCYGHEQVKSPHIDRLARRGVRFDRAYCTFPLCGPSRNSMLTGLYPNGTGIFGNGQIFRQTIPAHLSLPQLFRLNGYFAARIGKLYHYNVPNSVGTNGHDDPASWEVETNPAGVDRLLEHPKIFSLVPGQFGGTLSWYASPEPGEKHTDHLLASDAEWILERCARESRPFFLAVGFYRPHTPYVAPKSYFEQYPLESMHVVDGVEGDRQDIPAAGLMSGKAEQEEMSDELRRQARQAYYASVTFMDDQVGRVLDALERLELSANTLVVFTSDHGYHLGEHGLWQKMSLFEESARVPLIMAGPGIDSSGATCRSPVSHVDLYPTLAALCGIQPQFDAPGQSMLPMLQEPGQAGRGWALSQVTRNRRGERFFGYSLRTDRWRYTVWNDGEAGSELYDHQHDPRELTNLAESAEHVAVRNELSNQLKQAIQQSLPAAGVVPEIRAGVWAPNLTSP